jgi:hypothetical protein
MSAGPADESGQSLSFQVLGNSNPGLFTAGPVIAANGTLTYTPAPNAFGTATITFRLHDNGGTANGGTNASVRMFTITVLGVNDNPQAVNDALTVSEDSRGALLDVLANDSSLPDMGEVLTVAAITSPAHGTAVVAPNGAGILYTPTPNYIGTDSFTYTISDGHGGTATATVTVTVLDRPDDALAVGVEPGVSSQARLIDATTGRVLLQVNPFPGFTGGINAASGDVNGDGTPDLVIGAGAGAAGGHVKVYDGVTGQELMSFFSFPGFMGGVNVAAGDIDGDGRADVVVGAGPGAPGGHVKVFSAATGAEIYSFFAYDLGFIGGASVATGDVDGDGRTDFITGSGAGAPNGHVKVFSGKTGAELMSFYAYVGFNGGVRVSAGDIDGDGKAEIFTGTFAAAPHVKAFNSTGQELTSFYAFDPTLASTVDVAAVDVNGDGRKDLVAVARYGAVPQTRVFHNRDFAEIGSPFLLDDILGGVDVG